MEVLFNFGSFRLDLEMSLDLLFVAVDAECIAEQGLSSNMFFLAIITELRDLAKLMSFACIFTMVCDYK